MQHRITEQQRIEAERGKLFAEVVLVDVKRRTRLQLLTAEIVKITVAERERQKTEIAAEQRSKAEKEKLTAEEALEDAKRKLVTAEIKKIRVTEGERRKTAEREAELEQHKSTEKVCDLLHAAMNTGQLNQVLEGLKILQQADSKTSANIARPHKRPNAMPQRCGSNNNMSSM